MTETLLPSNASPLEQELAKTWRRIDEINVDAIATLWDAWRIPAVLLPWLAFALSVDQWDEQWDEVRKRQAIADSPNYHRLKGTRWAVEKSLDLLQRGYVVTEWWDRLPRARRGTFKVLVIVNDGDDLRALRARAYRGVHSSKPKSRMAFVEVGTQTLGAHGVLGGQAFSNVLTIGPYFADMPDITGQAYLAGATFTQTVLTIRPSGS